MARSERFIHLMKMHVLFTQQFATFKEKVVGQGSVSQVFNSGGYQNTQLVRESLRFAQGKRGQIMRREPSARKGRGEVWRWKRRDHALGRARRTQPGKQRPGCPAAPGRRFPVTLTAGPPPRSSVRAGRALRAGTEPGCPSGGQPRSRGATRSGFEPRFYHPAYKNHATDWTGRAPPAN